MEKSIWGYVLAGVSGFVLGFAGGWVANDAAREAETNPPPADNR